MSTSNQAPTFAKFLAKTIGALDPLKPKVTNAQRKMMLHALGINGVAMPQHRNYFATEPDDADAQALVALGLMEQDKIKIPGGMVYFHVTKAGKIFLEREILIAERDYWMRRAHDLQAAFDDGGES